MPYPHPPVKMQFIERLRIVGDFRNYSDWGIEHAFHNRFLLYNEFKDTLENYSDYKLTAQEILSPFKILVRNDKSDRIPAW